MNDWQGRPSEVLIVGAGPSGLMMACQLSIQQISFRIIDKKENSSAYSGALIVHARSMEIFNQMGIAEKFIQESILPNRLSIVINGKKMANITLKNFGLGLTKYPNLYLIEQSNTEKLLIDYLSSKFCFIERNTEFQQFTQDETGVTSLVQLPDGNIETIKTKYLIATDGGNSKIREQLKIPFIGKRHPVKLFILDCKAELDLPLDEICLLFSNYSTSGIFPLKGKRQRIDGIIPKELKDNKIIKFEDIATKFGEKLGTDINLYNPEWFSTSWSNQQYALLYQDHRCFLVGDAAHLISPVGAQGMNTGLQDAYNLAWKLAFVIQGKVKSVLLNTYSEERKIIAKKTMQTSGFIYNLVTSQNRFIKISRLHILPYLLKLILPHIEKQNKLRKCWFKAISEIGIKYNKGLLLMNASFGKFPANTPKPGERLPFFVYKDKDEEIQIQEKINILEFNLLIFTLDYYCDELKSISEKYKKVLSFIIIPLTSNTKIIYKSFGIKYQGWYLIRPDMYIAYRSSMLNVNHLNNYLQQYVLI